MAGIFEGFSAAEGWGCFDATKNVAIGTEYKHFNICIDLEKAGQLFQVRAAYSENRGGMVSKEQPVKIKASYQSDTESPKQTLVNMRSFSPSSFTAQMEKAIGDIESAFLLAERPRVFL